MRQRGALAGLAGGAAFTSVGGIGFIGNAIARGTSYAASSGITSMGNSAYFNDPMPSLKQFGIGMGISMLTAGIMGGNYAAKNKGDFWTGEGMSFDTDVSHIELTPEKTLECKENAIKIHNSGDLAEDMKAIDELLNCDPNIKAGYSRLGTSLTTDASLGYQLGYTDKGYIIHLGKVGNGDIVNATTQLNGKVFASGTSTVYYSWAVLNASEIGTEFPYIYKQSILVHELAHAYHNSNPIFLIRITTKLYTMHIA